MGSNTQLSCAVAMHFEPSVEQARTKIAALARIMLTGNLSFIEGTLKILALWREARLPHDDVDMQAFVVVDSETDAFPVGDVKLLWEPAALARLQPEIDRAEAWAREFGAVHCQNLIDRLGS